MLKALPPSHLTADGARMAKFANWTERITHSGWMGWTIPSGWQMAHNKWPKKTTKAVG
jgi:hypothetical protein